MRILMHCNGGPRIGSGHVARTVAIAEEAIASGHKVSVIGAIEPGIAGDLVASLGIDVVPIPEGDASALVSEARNLQAEVMHLDTYETNVHLRDHDSALLVSNLHDGRYGDRPAHLGIDPNLGADLDATTGRADIRLRGPRYAPLRRSVVEQRRSVGTGQQGVRSGAPLRVLVTMGSTDPKDLTPGVVELLRRTGLDLEVTVVGPAGMPCGAPPGLTYRGPTPDLPRLLAENDFVVSAAGSTVLELSCLGVPMALVCATDNQSVGYARAVEAGAALGLVPLGLDPASQDVDQLTRALTSGEVRSQLASAASRLVDGYGSWRVVRAWEQLTTVCATSVNPSGSVDLRPAMPSDRRELLRWRNDDETRRWSRDHRVVTPTDHAAWLEATRASTDRHLLMASDDHGLVGSLRLDRTSEGWEVSITVAPEHRGRGLSRAILVAGHRHLSAATDEPVDLLATVHEDNERSRRLFTSAGYFPDSPPDSEGYMRYRREESNALLRSNPR